jgi:hypothetical protein
LLLVLNVVLGPTCTVLIETPVQRQRLVGITRVRRARRLIKRIEPDIQKSQGTFTREEILDRVRGVRVSSGARTAVVEAPPVIEPRPEGAS